MLMSIQQKYIAELLDEFGCIKTDSLLILLRQKFNSTECQMNAMLNQLVRLTADFRLKDGLLYLSERGICQDTAEAVSIMLAVSGNRLLGFKSASKPYLLRFILDTGNGLKRFAAAECTADNIDKIRQNDDLPFDCLLLVIDDKSNAAAAEALTAEHIFVKKNSSTGNYDFFKVKRRSGKNDKPNT